MGPGQRDVPSRPGRPAVQPRRVLRQPGIAMDARHEREHERPGPSVPAQRHRLTSPRRRRPRRYRDQAEHQTTQDPGLENLHGCLRTGNIIEVIVATIARIRPRTQAAPEGHYSLGSDKLFFPDGNTGPALLQLEEAKAVCRRCEVAQTCLTWAID